MPFYKFGPNDIFHNEITTHPEQSFLIYRSNIYKNNQPLVAGAFVSSVPGNVPTGYANLYELNVDRSSASPSQIIYPFITKDGSLTSFNTISTSNFNNDFVYGDKVTGSYPLSATISSEWFDLGSPVAGARKREIQALKTALESYSPLSPNYAYSSSLGDKLTQEMRIVSIPSIFFGSSIRKGTISVKFYITGTLAGELVDDLQNGELRQKSPKDINSGSVAGVALYNEGFLLLTGSWAVSALVDQYVDCGVATTPRWIDVLQVPSRCGVAVLTASSFGLDFEGTQPVPVKTMFAHAPRAELNYSSNPTYLKFGSSSYGVTTGTLQYSQYDQVPIKNVVSGAWAEPTAPFSKVTYISKIGIYDDDKNLIGVAKLASPVRKREKDEFTFKLKLDF